jgi:WD40 repeat protein/mono/diheme cytochrome c family protein
MPKVRFAAAVAVVLPFAVIAADPPKPVPTAKVSYFKDVRPILQQHCQGCHQPAKAQGGYVMTDHAGLLSKGDGDKPGVVPGKPEASFLLDEIRVTNGKAEMPKNGAPLKPEQYQIIEAWIKQGAVDDTPESAKAKAIDAEHPPVYLSPPVITSLAFSPDGELLAVTGYHEILIYTADGSKLVARLVGLSERVQSVAFSPDGKWLAASAGDPGRFGEIQIWDVAKRRLKISVPITFDTVYGVSWSPDGKKVAFGCSDNTVRAIAPDTGQQVLQMGTHSDWVLGTVFSRDGEHLVSVSRDMSAKLTEVPTQRFIDNVTSITPGALKGGLMAVDVRPVTEKKITKVPDDEGGRFQEKNYDELIIAGSDGTPRLYKAHRETKRIIGDDANKIRQYEPLLGRVSAAKFDADGKRFAAVASLDGQGEVSVYYTDSEKKAVRCEGVTGPAYAVAWRKGGKTLASGGFDGKVWLHDAETGKLVSEFVAVPK